MSENKENIKDGITLHTIETKNFKTNLLAVFLTLPLSKGEATLNTLLTLVLRRGSKTMPSQEDISKCLENMYGASFDCGIEKTGDNHVLKFYLEAINDEYLPKKQELLKESLDRLLDIILNPFVENGAFKEEYVQGEKENLKQIIEGKIDNKGYYALERCIEEMYQGKPYGIYKYGYVEDLEQITAKSLYDHYKKVIENCKMDIFISGDLNEEAVSLVKENKLLGSLTEREAKYVINNEETEKKEQEKETKTIEESMDIAQGKLVMGLNIHDYSEKSKFVSLVYNAILGGTANSKMFQNVREKESLAYSASSGYLRQKNNIFIRCGIEVENYQKAVQIINKQLEDMQTGNFSDDDMDNAKNFIVSTIRGITDEQDTEISYYLGQELAGNQLDFETYEKEIQDVTKQDVIDLAKKITTDTIYFLKK